jgi:hypothetical protein
MSPPPGERRAWPAAPTSSQAPFLLWYTPRTPAYERTGEIRASVAQICAKSVDVQQL